MAKIGFRTEAVFFGKNVIYELSIFGWRVPMMEYLGPFRPLSHPHNFTTFTDDPF